MKNLNLMERRNRMMIWMNLRMIALLSKDPKKMKNRKMTKMKNLYKKKYFKYKNPST